MTDAVTLERIPEPRFGAAVSPWCWWFAWKPIHSWDGRFVWFRWVKRRRIQKHEHLDGEPLEQWWQYAAPWGYATAYLGRQK